MQHERRQVGGIIQLPEVKRQGAVSLEESLLQRRSVREFASRPLTLDQIGQLLWAAQGITGKLAGLRAAPSAGALYPLELDVVLPAGVFRYDPRKHEMRCTVSGDQRAELQVAALRQESITQAAAVFVISAVIARTARKYGDRAWRYVLLEAGHACQNLLLQATALGLGGVPIGAFYDESVASVLHLGASEQPFYLIPIGYPAE